MEDRIARRAGDVVGGGDVGDVVGEGGYYRVGSTVLCKVDQELWMEFLFVVGQSYALFGGVGGGRLERRWHFGNRMELDHICGEEGCYCGGLSEGDDEDEEDSEAGNRYFTWGGVNSQEEMNGDAMAC